MTSDQWNQTKYFKLCLSDEVCISLSIKSETRESWENWENCLYILGKKTKIECYRQLITMTDGQMDKIATPWAPDGAKNDEGYQKSLHLSCLCHDTMIRVLGRFPKALDLQIRCNKGNGGKRKIILNIE